MTARRARRHAVAAVVVMVFTVAAGVAPPGGSRAHANIRAPIFEPRPPSSAARPVTKPNDQLTVLNEALTFRCSDTACDVEARYRILASAPLAAELAFVSPQAEPLAVRVGTAAATVAVTPVAPEPVEEPSLHWEARELAERHLTAVEARFSAIFAAGENVVTVSYQQPLGREEHGHSYFSKGRFVQLFRYELWPLREWKRAPDFRIDGDVAIRRPAPSWFKRVFSTPRGLGCKGSEPLRSASVQQRGEELHFQFQVTDPIPRRLWCKIGDQDLVPAP
jgi:hypothetical protein